MKKIYIGILAVAFAGTASAQTVKQATKNAVNKFNTISEVPAKATVNEEKVLHFGQMTSAIQLNGLLQMQVQQLHHLTQEETGQLLRMRVQDQLQH